MGVLPGIQDSLNGRNGVSFLDQQSILYSIPLHHEEEIVGVLAGVRSKKNMQNLIQPQSFGGKRINLYFQYYRRGYYIADEFRTVFAS